MQDGPPLHRRQSDLPPGLKEHESAPCQERIRIGRSNQFDCAAAADCFCISSRQLSTRSPSEPFTGARLQIAKQRFARTKLVETCQKSRISATFVSGPARETTRFFIGVPASRTTYIPF